MLLVFFLYEELLLRLLNGTGVNSTSFPLILTAAGAGAVFASAAALLRRRSPKGAAVLELAVSVLTAVLFATESMIRSAFTTYMAPGNLFSGAGNVLENYRGEFLRSVTPWCIRLVLFLLPLILYRGGLYLKARKEKSAAAENTETGNAEAGDAETGDAEAGDAGSGKTEEKGVRPVIALLAAGILALAAAPLLILRGPDAGLYGAQYSYNAAVETFGLLTAGRLDLTYGIFGNPYIRFNGEMEATASDPTVSDTAASDAAAADATASDAAAPEEAEKPSVPNVMEIDFSAEALSKTKSLAGLTAYVSTRKPSYTNAYTGLFRGKNLILICAESYCDRFIRPELTPTLWRLTHNGIYFEEYYQSEWGGSTTTGELAFVEGLSGNEGDESLIRSADHNHYFTMGNQLQRLGYSSIAFHNGSYSYYKRQKTHENLGYNQYIGSGSGIEKIAGHKYPTDSEMLELTPELYVDHQPFSVYYMTLSGHAPYEKGSPYVRRYYDQVDAAVGDEYFQKTKYYICYQMELETAVTRLVEQLEKAGIADDTVIVLTGDHYPYGLGNGRTWKNDRDYIDDLIKGNDAVRWEQDRSGLIIWCGSLEHEDREMACTVSDPVGNLDILPTLSNLFGVEFDSRLLPGRDALAPETEPLVFWNNLSFVVREGKYDSRKKNWFPNEGYEWTATDPEFLQKIHDTVNDRLLMSRTIQKTDYYGLLFGPDEIHEAGDILYLREK